MSEFVSGNPVFDLSLPYQAPAFDRIRDADYAAAFEQGMREQLAEIEAIAANPEPATFDNTVLALESSGARLDRASRIFFNLTGAHTNDRLEALQRTLAPQLAAHRDRIMLDGALFARIARLYATRDTLSLDAESMRLVERYFRDFTRAGAALSAADKERLRAINSALASDSTLFSQNLLKGTNAACVMFEDAGDLAGLSSSEIQAAAELAEHHGHPGRFAIAIVNTTQQPLEERLVSRASRLRLRQAASGRCLSGPFDNRAVILNLARLRAERARLLGYAHHAAYVLEDETAGSAEEVNTLLAALAPRAVANVKKEAELLQDAIARQGQDHRLAAHDWAFYAAQVKRERYHVDFSQVERYFELERVLKDGLFYAATRLYGITFAERHDLPVYHPDVRTFAVANADGSPLALFIADFYARPSKRGGAWMNEYVGRSQMTGTLPVVGNHLNIPKPKADAPTLLTLTELTTLFHEFGHALHGMFSNVHYPRFAGLRVPRDFVEFPSQVNEMWALWPEVLSHYAYHHETGAPMPAEIAAKVEASAQFNQGFATAEYLAAAVLDQAWHQLSVEAIPHDVEQFERDALARAGLLIEQVLPRYRSSYFSHIFAGGYSAGYYAYIWSEILDADAGDWFRDHAGLQRQNGDWFRDTLLSKGGSEDAKAMYRSFRGRDAQPEALLKRRGLEGQRASL